MATSTTSSYYPVEIYSSGLRLHGELTIPPSPVGTVVVCHDSSCGRLGNCSRYVSMRLNARRISSLVVDLMTMDEDYDDQRTGCHRNEVERPARRIASVVDWLHADPLVGELPIGLLAYGQGSCGPACLLVAADRPGDIAAVAMRCGRPDRAGRALGQPVPPTLLIVGGDDVAIQRQNKDAFRRLRTDHKHIEFVDGASHGFTEAGKFDEATALAVDWFAQFLVPSVRGRAELC